MTAKTQLARGELGHLIVLALAAVVLGAVIFYAYDWYTMDRFTVSIVRDWSSASLSGQPRHSSQIRTRICSMCAMGRG
jgi:hypothetical protein